MTGFLILAFLILVAGVVAVPLASRFGLGSVLGYLLAGMAISPLLSALRVDVEALQVFAEFGVVMMLFIIGLEMEPQRLWAMRGKLAGLGGGQVLLTTLAIGGIALFAGQPWQSALAIGMVLALSSTAIIVQSLTEKGLMRTEGGEASFSVLLVQDVAVIPILALLPLLALPELGGAAAASGEGAHGGIDLTAQMNGWLAGATRVGAVAAVIAIGIYAIRPLFRYIARTNLRELFTAAALLVVIGIALLMTLVGLSPALGAFIAGVVLATSEYRHELESDINPFKGLLLGLFFITVGAGIDFALAGTIWRSVVFWALVAIAAKMAVLLVVGRLYGLRREALWLFCLSLPQAGEFAFVLIAFAVANAVFDQAMADQLLLIVALDEREQIDKLVRYACATFPDLHVVARAKNRDHVYHLWAMGCRDIVRETYDSALRMGRSVYEALGHDRQAATAMVEAWEEMDRTSMREIADVYRLDIPPHENEELLAKIRELKKEWDPKLRDAMDEIAARGR